MALIGRAGWGDSGHLQPSQLDQGPVRRPQGGDVVCRIALASQLQEEAERDRAVSQAALQFLAQKIRTALARIVRGEIGFPGFGYPAIAAESAGAIRGSEFKGVLRIVAGLPIAGRKRFLRQTLDESACGR